MHRDKHFWRAWTAVAAVTWLVVVLIVIPPFVGLGPRAVIMSGFSQVCHQLPHRSPTISGVQLAVCHRCFGIYGGIALASLAFVILVRHEDFLGRHAAKILLLSLVPLGIDWAAGIAGLYANTAFTRAFSGGVFGLVAGLYLCRAVLQLFRSRRRTDEQVLPSEGTGAA